MEQPKNLMAEESGRLDEPGAERTAEEDVIHAELVAFVEKHREYFEHYAREKGLLRTEGKEYIVKDGDVVEFKI